MASIATGLDYDTEGKKTSTGAKMRSHQDDQEGGTDSRDARQAWSQGYGENLDIQDGNSWAQLLADLKDYRLVHIDVWHKTVGSQVCVSGSGAYGHTMAVLPDCKDNQWLVADPWCNPPKWQRVDEAKLRAGAEEWGNRVYGKATSGPGRDWKANPPTLDELREVARELMTIYHAGGAEDPSEDPGDTGGGQRIMYTATTGHAPGSGGGSVGIKFDMRQWTATNDIPVYLEASTAQKVTTISKGVTFVSVGYKAAVDENGLDSNWVAVRVKTGGLIPGSDDVALEAILWAQKSDMPGDGASQNPTPAGWDASVWSLMGTPTGVYPCPPPVPGPGDCTDEVAQAINARDDEWREWLLDGAPGQRDGPPG
jgi:hypothetical protein